jgi:phage shock protein C
MENRGKNTNAVMFGPKRLYQIPDGAIITGVVKGIAVYFNIDPKVLRWAFLILTILTKGGLAVVYMVMMVIIPVAKTEEDYAKAYGHALRRSMR